MTRCKECPCPQGLECHSQVIPAFCDWARSGDRTKRDHIVNRSRIAQDASSVKTFPPIATQVGNALKAAQTFLVAPEVSSQEEQSRRLSICKGCDQFQGGRCVQCGCSLWLKVKGKNLHCPIDKW